MVKPAALRQNRHVTYGHSDYFIGYVAMSQNY